MSKTAGRGNPRLWWVLLTAQRVKLGGDGSTPGALILLSLPLKPCLGGPHSAAAAVRKTLGMKGPAASVPDASAPCAALQGLTHRLASLGRAGVGAACGEGL